MTVEQAEYVVNLTQKITSLNKDILEIQRALDYLQTYYTEYVKVSLHIRQ